jgi:ATP-dependent DNA helicase RecQ
LEILEYFGDPARAACGCCDNCPAPKTSRAKQDEPAEVHNESLLEVVRIVLSGVARCNRRFGKHLVAKMLCGSSSAQITKLRLDKLSTFGLLDELKQTETIEIIDALLQCHLLEQIEIQPHRPIVQLTEFGSEVMRGLAHFDMRLPVRKGLLKKLRKRKTISPSSTDSTKSPGQHTSVKATHTIAPNGVNVDSAADRLDADESNRSAEQCTGTPPDQPQSQPSHYWTWRLLDSGFTVAECAQIRRLETPAIVDHVIRAAEAGMTVEPLWLLSPSQLAAIENLIGDTSPEHIQPLLSRLPPDVRCEHVQYFLACRRNPSSNGQQHNSNAGNRTETDSTAP